MKKPSISSPVKVDLIPLMWETINGFFLLTYSNTREEGR